MKTEALRLQRLTFPTGEDLGDPNSHLSLAASPEGQGGHPLGKERVKMPGAH